MDGRLRDLIFLPVESQESTVNPILISPGTYLFQGRLRGGAGGGLIQLNEYRSLHKELENRVEKL